MAPVEIFSAVLSESEEIGSPLLWLLSFVFVPLVEALLRFPAFILSGQRGLMEFTPLFFSCEVWSSNSSNGVLHRHEWTSVCDPPRSRRLSQACRTVWKDNLLGFGILLAQRC